MFNTMTRNARQLARDVGREAHDLLERGLVKRGEHIVVHDGVPPMALPRNL